MGKMELVGQPGNIQFPVTYSRKGALGAAIGYMIECGHRELRVSIAADRQCFTVTPDERKAPDSQDSVAWQRGVSE